MDINFGDWLSKKMREHNWTQSDLARHSGLTRQAISYYLSSKSRYPDERALTKIARAFKIPPEEVFRQAGLLPSKKDNDELLDRIEYLYNELEDPANKKRALDFLEFLMIQEERGEYLVPKKAEQVPAKTD
jgi:transcriptional regulator with XRE-family HTH domain